jgi:hypothetical protein
MLGVIMLNVPAPVKGFAVQVKAQLQVEFEMHFLS